MANNQAETNPEENLGADPSLTPAVAEENASPEAPKLEDAEASHSGKPAKARKSAKKTAAKAAANKAAKAPAKSKRGAKARVKPAKSSAKAAKRAPKPAKPVKPAKAASKRAGSASAGDTAQLLSSAVVYEGPLFRVMQERIVEPGGRESSRDVIRHNGSVVILAVDPGKKKKDPWIVVERQYRHAAGQYLWELPAGKLDAGEAPIDGAKRELSEETGYRAKKWSPLVEYYASPGFLGESMKVFLAEGLIPGDAHPEEDEQIDFRLVKLSELLEMVDKGKIVDGKTLNAILLYARFLGLKRKR